jgi:hypothetical protein
VLVTAVLRPQEREDGELEVVRVALQQLPDSLELPVGQTEGPVERLFRDRSQRAIVSSPSASPDILRAMTAATFAGLLSDEERLRVFAAVALGATTSRDVAEASGLEEERVQSVLPRLVTAGLIDQVEGLHVRTDSLGEASRDRPARRRELPDATPAQAAVLRNFVEDGRLRRLPARAAQRGVVLEYLADRFEPGREYPEPEVNELLAAYHDDHVTLRRLLVDERLLERSDGVYRRTP